MLCCFGMMQNDAKADVGVVIVAFWTASTPAGTPTVGQGGLVAGGGAVVGAGGVTIGGYIATGAVGGTLGGPLGAAAGAAGGAL